jgi:DNA-binding transcriptional ArsR family regulator
LIGGRVDGGAGLRRQWRCSISEDGDPVTADKVFEALSSAPRRRILAFLSRTDMTAGEIVARFAGIMSQPAISKHLSVLEASGLVWREKRGQNVHYGLRQEALAAPLVQFLAQVCPRSRPYRRDSAAAAKRKKGA